MEKKESTTSSSKRMCGKLFNVFNPASRSHHHLTLHHQEPRATTNPSPTQPNHSLDSGIKEPSPQKALSTPVKPKAEPKPTPPPPPPTSLPVQKGPDKAARTPAPRRTVTLPQPAPPKDAAMPAEERSKKNINEKVEDYIKRAREKIRAVSGVGRAPPPPPPPTSFPVQKGPDKAARTPAPRRTVTLPQPAPPKDAAMPAEERSKKNINERVEDYIKRAKEKIRAVSGVGRAPPPHPSS